MRAQRVGPEMPELSRPREFHVGLPNFECTYSCICSVRNFKGTSSSLARNSVKINDRVRNFGNSGQFVAVTSKKRDMSVTQ